MSPLKLEGEILQGYDDGIVAEGSDGTLDEVAVTFNTPSYVFSEQDVGGYIVFPDPLSDINKGKFRILEVIDSNTVLLETEFGFVSETPIDWILTHTYEKVVTTDKRTYTYPFYVPIRSDVQDSANFGTLTFEAFEPLTIAFTVTDYLEDPHWWHNKHIPSILWKETVDGDTTPSSASLARRLATTQLYENVIGPDDDLKIGDPGFFIGADDDGNVLTPTQTHGPNIGSPAPIYRHTAAFILFDRYVKLHMFFIEIHEDLELTRQFKDDLEELVLVAKPSYTYPFVESNEAFLDEIELHFGGDEDGKSDSLVLANNELVIGDSAFPWSIGDYYKYDISVPITVPGAPDPVTAGYFFTLPLPNPTDRPLTVNINATVGGKPVLEGRDYTVNWLKSSPNAWRVTALTDWDSVSPLTVTIELAEVDNVSLTPIPDTVIGWTPIFIGGLNPFYIRNGALDPDSPTYAADWAAVRTENIDRPLELKIDIGGGLPYTYP